MGGSGAWRFPGLAGQAAGLAMVLALSAAGPHRAWAAASQPAPALIRVFAAASLGEVMQELGAAYRQAGGAAVTVSVASTAVLARQIEAGAAADVFVAADQQWMDYLQARQLVQGQSRRALAGNVLVLIAPADSSVRLRLAPGAPLAASLGGGRLAVGDPDSVPLGRYARAALTSLGLWDEIAARLVRADDARVALAFVARGEAPLGIVYATDAQRDARVRIVAIFPVGSHPAIVYPAALTVGAAPAAADFLRYLGSAAARQRLRRYGFIAP